ncbi:MAG TPA: hypothetical protein VG755_14905 [Nannocystaceae bacterium]|nr:hypothetical protein [Nannocystaceae bacterium]
MATKTSHCSWLAIVLVCGCNNASTQFDTTSQLDETSAADTTTSASTTTTTDASTSTAAESESSTAAADSSSTGEAPPAIGTVETFAALGGANEGLAFGDGPDGEPTLYVGLNEAHQIVRIAPDGTVTMHVEVPGPLGMAKTRDGDLVVCGLESTDADAPGAIWRVTPAGDASLLVQSADPLLELTNYVAIAPDDTIAFSDSAGNVLYRADADGSNLAVVTDTLTYPNGLAFADGKLYVASYDSSSMYALDYADGVYGAPVLVSDAIMTLDGIAIASDASFYLTTTLGGVQRFAMDELTTIADAMEFQVSANGAFAAEGYGDGWLYVTNLFGDDVRRVYVGIGGMPLPAE